MRNRSKSWTTGLSPDDKKNFEADWAASLPVRERLQVLLENKLKSLEKERTSYDLVQEPNLLQKHIDICAEERAYKAIIELLHCKS